MSQSASSPTITAKTVCFSRPSRLESIQTLEPDSVEINSTHFRQFPAAERRSQERGRVGGGGCWGTELPLRCWLLLVAAAVRQLTRSSDTPASRWSNTSINTAWLLPAPKHLPLAAFPCRQVMPLCSERLVLALALALALANRKIM